MGATNQLKSLQLIYKKQEFCRIEISHFLQRKLAKTTEKAVQCQNGVVVLLLLLLFTFYFHTTSTSVSKIVRRGKSVGPTHSTLFAL
jgi:hypothetical protein